MKLMQCSLVGAGILLICVPAIQGGVSSPSNVASVTTPSSGSTAVAEWYGPFASWDNVKTKYGAVGDGATDDTAAISNALANVGVAANSPVLYFPAGIYRVTQKLLLKYRARIEIWGADPDTTKILWDGSTGGTLFHVNGLVDSVIARLTFDGNNKNGVVVDYNFDGGSSAYFDSGSSILDCQFKNGQYGVRGGYSGVGFANNNFRRCRFSNLTYGLTTHNANAFEIHLIDGTVQNCSRGIWTPMGGINAYRTLFKSNAWDAYWPYSFSFGSLVSNVSYRSGGFLYMGNSTPYLVKGNTIIDPTNTVPLYINQGGPLMMVDNTVMQSGATAAIQMGGGLKPDALLVGNRFTTANYFSVISGSDPIHTNFVDNTVVSYSTLTPPAPAVWSTNLNRNTVEVSASGNGTAIQNAIYSVTNRPGSVVHIASGSHGVTSTITVPGGLDVRIVGDGSASGLNWGGPTDGSPLFKLATPTQARLINLQCNGYSKASTLVKVEAGSSTTARVLLRDCKWLYGANADFYLADLPNMTVEQFGIAADYSPGIAWHLAGRGKMRVFGTDGGQPHIGFVATNGVDLYVETHDTESDSATTWATISGPGTVSFVSGKMYLGAVSTQGLVVTNFSGRCLFGIYQPFDQVNVCGTGTGEVWVVGNQGAAALGSTPYTVNASSGTTLVGSMNQYVNNAILKWADQGTADPAFVRRLLNHMRAVYPFPDAPVALPSGQIDTIWERVYLQQGQRNVEIGP